MNVLYEVMTIAIGTAVLAALIVAADWDIAVIQAWQDLTLPREHTSSSTGAWHSATDERPVVDRFAGYPNSSETETARPTTAYARFGNTDQEAAEAWLARAAAGQISTIKGPGRGRFGESALQPVPPPNVTADQLSD